MANGFTKKKVQCSVIGGGVIGLTLAFRLAQRGFNVLLIDKGKVGREASWAGAGILPPINQTDPVHPLDRLKLLSYRLHPEFSNELLELTGIDNEFQPCGGINLASTVGESAALIGSCELWEREKIRFERLDRKSLVELEPHLKPFAETNFKNAIYFPEESQIRNPRHLKALVAACKKVGVEFFEDCELQSISKTTTTFELQSSQRSILTEIVCVTAGAWTTGLLRGIGSKSEVVPIKGHMLLYKLPTQCFFRVLNEGNRYLVPRKDGHVLVGSSEEETGFDQSISETEIANLKKFASGILPDLEDAKLVQTWTGLRPMSFDQIPYLGQHSEIENLFIATGHYRGGLQLSTGTAHVLTQLISGEPLEFDLNELRPER